MTINFKSWKTWVFIGVLLVLLFIVFKKCTPKYQSDPEIIGLLKQIERLKKDTSFLGKFYRGQNDSLKKNMDTLFKSYGVQQKKLSSLQNANNDYAVRIKEAKVVHDTLAYFDNCDTLASQVIEEHSIAENFKAISDSLIESHVLQLRLKDDEISGLNEALTRSVGINDTISRKYVDLDKQTSKQNRKLRRAQFLNKVLAGAVVICGVIIAL